MKFKNVVIQSLCAVDPPIRVTSREIEIKLKPTLDRLGVRDDLLEQVSGIGVRRFWEKGTSPSDAATLAAEKALDDSGIDRQKIGVIINTSVCRDYLEPSTACIVHGNLGLSENCLNFDVGNACLAFMNGMDIAARMIERTEIEYALIVDGESSRPITEDTIDRMLNPDIKEQQFRAEFASLTLGSGAAAMVMARKELAPRPNGPDEYRYPDPPERGPQTGIQDFQCGTDRTRLGGLRTGSVRDPPGQQSSH
jgi:3-oxoacyl-[acyl-carrier-protein] synthase-3